MKWLFVLLMACGGAQTTTSDVVLQLPASPSAAPPTSATSAPVHEERVVVARPAADRDGDGIPDDFDKCPDEPEDRDGFQDDDGCPDPDNDGDGILDINDQCPNEPGPAPTGCPQLKKHKP